MHELVIYIEVSNLFIENDMFNRLIVFLMNNQPGFETNFQKMGNSSIVEPNFNLIVEIIANILLGKKISNYSRMCYEWNFKDPEVFNI